MSKKDAIRETRNRHGFVTRREAGGILGKAPKTISKYISLGLLRPRKHKTIDPYNLLIRRDDVLALKEIQDSEDGWLTGAAEMLKAMKIKFFSLERRMDFLMMVNGMDISVLRDAPGEALLDVYRRIEHAMGQEQIKPNRMVDWVNLVLQFTEVEIERLVPLTQDPQPWKMLYTFCMQLMRQLRTSKRFGSNAGMQQTYRLLEKARKSISRAGHVFDEFHHVHKGKFRKLIQQHSIEDDTLDRFILEDLDINRCYGPR